MFLCIPLLFLFLWTKHPSWQKSCVCKCSVYHVHSYPVPVCFLSLRFWNHASQMSPYRITSVTGMCRRELCVVCPAPAAVVHLTWVAPSTEASTKPDITTPDRIFPPQISFPAAGTHLNGITIIDSADKPEEYTGPQERSHSFVYAYVMHCLKLPAMLSSCSPLRLQVRSKLMFNLEF